MCGITGYIGTDGALTHVLSGLQNLEYRGYDSAGVALTEPVDGTLSVYKRSGEVDQLLAAVPDTHPTRCAIGHTRWSTHGPPTDANAHPHTDCAGQVAVVHNGIIENYERLQADLAEHTFTSDTDTEVIPHLIEQRLAAGDEPVVAVRAVTD